jgi:hypothetical protein
MRFATSGIEVKQCRRARYVDPNKPPSAHLKKFCREERRRTRIPLTVVDISGSGDCINSKIELHGLDEESLAYVA